jgi:hypothetical protein
MKTYNIYIKTKMSTFNILNIDRADLEFIVDAYNHGRPDFFLGGKKYWLNNLFEIRIFEFDYPEKFDSFVELAKRNDLLISGMFGDSHLPPQVLKEGGKEVTRDFIKQEYGDQKVSSKTYNSSIKHQMEIFISHSNEDSNIAEALVNVIIKAFKVENKSIRCTSVPGFKLPSGASTDDQLKREIFSSKVFIGLITSKSINSTYVLFELGARWGSTLPLLPLICDPSGTSLLKGPLKNINVLNATDASDIHQFIYDLSDHLNIKPEDTNAYIKEIEILKNLSANITQEESRIPPLQVDEPNEFENAEEIIKAHSIKEWPDDYEMQIYVIEKQRSAVKKLKEGKPNDIDLETFKKIRERAKKEWPFDFEMRLHTEERQIDSYRNLKNI